MRNFLRIYKILCKYFTSNQCLKGSQPKVWMTIFLWVKLLVKWTDWRWPGVPQWPHLTADPATQQVSRQGQEPRHLGHTAPPGSATSSTPLALLLSLSPDPLRCRSILLWDSPAAGGGGGGGATEFSETEEQDLPLWLKKGFFSKCKSLSKSKNFS